MKCIGMGKYAPDVIKAVIADPGARVTAMKSLVEAVGGTWTDGFFIRGTYDFGFLCEMPNEEAVAAMHAIVYATGAVESVSIHTELDIGAVAGTVSTAMGAYTPPG